MSVIDIIVKIIKSIKKPLLVSGVPVAIVGYSIKCMIFTFE